MTTTEDRRARRRPRRPPRLAAAAVLTFLAAGLAACGDDAGPDARPGSEAGAEPADPVSAVPAPTADVTVDVTTQGGQVTVTYRYANTSADPVLVVQGPPGADSQQDPDRPMFATGDGDVVVLSQRAFPTPEPSAVDFAQAPRVGVSEVGPGEEVSDELTVPLPTERVQPYGNDLGFGPITLPEAPTGVGFCLGVIPSPYPPAISLEQDDAGRSIAHGTASAAAQHLFCAEVQPLSSS